MNMATMIRGILAFFTALAVLPNLHPDRAFATVDGISGGNFTLVAKAGIISTGDGQSLLGWGYANGGGLMQYPGPTMIVNQGQTVTVTLTNELAVPVSIVFPGQVNVIATGGATGTLTREAPPAPCATNCAVTYQFTASQPGTYLYHSGTQQDLEVEMGLVGALIVRPNAADPQHQAYEHPSSAFEREYLFLLTEMDVTIHRLVEFGLVNQVDFNAYHPTLWFINGRNAPDTMLGSGNAAPWLAYQPYNSMPQVHPGERALLRLIGAGRDLHPFHHHGNNAWTIARDGRLLQSAPGAGADLAESNFTITVVPGGTVDAIFTWTGEKLGWDIYGDPNQTATAHTCNNPTGFDSITHEYCPDHGKLLPTTMPELQSLTFGGNWSGSPFIGQLAPLPPGQGGNNPTGAFTFMWHSHTEMEMVNDDVFPGGMMTMMMIEHPSVTIP
ncbi:MAG: multicopper oxidase family protein [Nitrospira sp. CG24E]|nr:MAG: multicopper oxidase family protein [Nitrospira sp. CG24E]